MNNEVTHRLESLVSWRSHGIAELFGVLEGYFRGSHGHCVHAYPIRRDFDYNQLYRISRTLCEAWEGAAQ